MVDSRAGTGNRHEELVIADGKEALPGAGGGEGWESVAAGSR